MDQEDDTCPAVLLAGEASVLGLRLRQRPSPFLNVPVGHPGLEKRMLQMDIL
jgi:hypothetical protein